MRGAATPPEPSPRCATEFAIVEGRARRAPRGDRRPPTPSSSSYPFATSGRPWRRAPTRHTSVAATARSSCSRARPLRSRLDDHGRMLGVTNARAPEAEVTGLSELLRAAQRRVTEQVIVVFATRRARYLRFALKAPPHAALRCRLAAPQCRGARVARKGTRTPERPARGHPPLFESRHWRRAWHCCASGGGGIRSPWPATPPT